MSFRPAVSNSVNAPTAKISSAATATAVTTRLKRRASPTPQRWMPMKSAKQARQTGQPAVSPKRLSDSTYSPMKREIAAGARMYSMRIAVPVRKPPQVPSARRAKP